MGASHRSGLFLREGRRIAEEYANSGVAFNDMIVDNWCVNSYEDRAEEARQRR